MRTMTMRTISLALLAVFLLAGCSSTKKEEPAADTSIEGVLRPAEPTTPANPATPTPKPAS